MALGHGRTGRRVPDRTLRNQFLSLNRHSRPAHCRRNYRIGDRTYLCAISDGLLLALLHRCLDRNRGPMNVWDWEPSVIFGCSALAIGYIVLVRKHGFHRAPYFLAGVILLLFDLVSPIDTLADRYLFSAHIVQHFLLALVIPPLLLLGTPRFDLGSLNKLEGALGQPPVSWLLGVGTMLAWHIPTLFNAALANDGLHIFQHLSFLVTGTIYWWPILAPVSQVRLSVTGSISYLFTACLSCSLLGAALTFSPPGLYPAYLHPQDWLGILPLLRDG